MILDIESPVEKPIKSYIGNDLVWVDTAGFTPAELFIDGEQGVWLDPSDLSTMFQDVNGTEPVTKYGDPVGLILDKSQGLVRKKLDPTGWDKFTNSTVLEKESDGRHRVSMGERVVAARVFSQTSITSGKLYYLELDIESKGGVSYLRTFNSIGSEIGSIVIGSVPDGNRQTIKGHLYATENTSYVGVSVNATSSTVALIGELKVYEVLGNHATQPTASARPIYRTDGKLHWLAFDGVDDHLICVGANSNLNVPELTISMAAMTQNSYTWFLCSSVSANYLTTYSLRRNGGRIEWVNKGAVSALAFDFSDTFVATSSSDNAEMYIRLNSGEVQKGTIGSSRDEKSGDMLIGQSSPTNTYQPYLLRGNFYGLVMTTKFSDLEQQGQLHNLMKVKVGLPL